MPVLAQPPDFQIPRLPVRRFSVAEYHQMIEVGILGEDDNVELLRGLIVPKMSRKPPHDCVLGMIDFLIQSVLPKKWINRAQMAITLRNSEPEPDIAVVHGPIVRYFSHNPKPENIGQVVEVSDTTLDKDRQEKLPIYADAKIPYYWIINIPEQTVEVYSDPVEDNYQARKDYRKGDMLPVILDGLEVGTISVIEILKGV